MSYVVMGGRDDVVDPAHRPRAAGGAAAPCDDTVTLYGEVPRRSGWSR